MNLIVLALFVWLQPAGLLSGAGQTAPLPSRFAQFDGQRVHYQSHGAGDDALVFVHGGMGNLNRWQKQLPVFAGKTRLILLDLPGHGQSDKPKLIYSVDYLARAVEAVLRDAGVKRSVLVGMSMGTPIIRQFYRRFPAKVLGLVFVDGPLKPLAPSQEVGEQFVSEFRGPNYLKAAEQFLETFIYKLETPAENRKMELANWTATPQHVMVSVLEQVILPNAAPESWKPDKINVPVLAFFTKNPYVNAENETFLRSFVASLEYHVLDSSHNLVMERAAEFNSALLAFLQKHDWVRPAAVNKSAVQPDKLSNAIEQLRHTHGHWAVTTEFLNEDGSVAKAVRGTYRFAWVVPDRVLSGQSAIPELKQVSGILFYVSEKRQTIEMTSVGADGTLWIMCGVAGEETRTTPPFPGADGKETQLRFIRYNVQPDSFESKMEYTTDGGKTWRPGNHQIFRRA